MFWTRWIAEARLKRYVNRRRACLLSNCLVAPRLHDFSMKFYIVASIRQHHLTLTHPRHHSATVSKARSCVVKSEGARRIRLSRIDARNSLSVLSGGAVTYRASINACLKHPLLECTLRQTLPSCLSFTSAGSPRSKTMSPYLPPRMWCTTSSANWRLV